MSKQITKSVSVVGHFGFGENLVNGQTIKTKTVTEALENRIGKDEVIKVDTHGGIKAYIKIPFQLISSLQKTKNIIIFPAHNGLKVIAPLLVILNKFHNRRLHYCVIGGWLPEMCESKKWLAKVLKKFDYIYVETRTMKAALEQQGFTNAVVMPNFKNLQPLTEEQLVYQYSEPYKLCTFSRVMEEKGIEDAVNAVKTINETNGRTVYQLDIYGQVDSEQTEWFEELKLSFPEYIQYKGLVTFNETVDVVKEYFALLFPTKFYTEGIPGTILDAYAAGVPIIASKWESFDDLIEDGKTGIGYEFGNRDELVSLLSNFAKHPSEINALKNNCLEKAEQYAPNEIIKILEMGGYCNS